MHTHNCVSYTVQIVESFILSFIATCAKFSRSAGAPSQQMKTHWRIALVHRCTYAYCSYIGSEYKFIASAGEDGDGIRVAHAV